MITSQDLIINLNASHAPVVGSGTGRAKFQRSYINVLKTHAGTVEKNEIKIKYEHSKRAKYSMESSTEFGLTGILP